MRLSISHLRGDREQPSDSREEPSHGETPEPAKTREPKVSRGQRRDEARQQREIRESQREEEHETRRAARDMHREMARARRSQRVARMTRLATRTVTNATGHQYQRVGFASTGRRVLAYVALVFVMVSVAAMSWSGEYAWFTHRLGWTAGHATLGCISLDVAAMTCALLAVDQIDKGESGIGFRFFAAVLVGLAAWINWRTALATGDITRQVFFPAMSVIAYGLVHLVLAAARREARRRQHGHKSRERVKPLPRFGALVWVPVLGKPRLALNALRDAIELRLRASLAMAGLTLDDDDEEAADESRAETSGREEESHDDEPDLSTGSLADAIRTAITLTDGRAQNVVDYLKSHGRPGVATSRVYDVLRRDRVTLVAPRTETPDETEEIAQ